jgi:DNA modification methylase
MHNALLRSSEKQTKLIHGDRLLLMRELPAGSVDMVVTSPAETERLGLPQ